MAAPSFVAAVADTTLEVPAVQNTYTVSTPGAAALGDILVFSLDTGNNTVSSITGTLIPVGPTGDARIRSYYLVYDGTPTTYTAVLGGSPFGSFGVAAVRGAKSTAPTVSNGSDTGNPMVVPTITTPTSDCLYVLMAGTGTGATTINTPAGMTLGLAGSQTAFGTFYETRPTAGATGTRNLTNSSGTVASYAYSQFVLSASAGNPIVMVI